MTEPTPPIRFVEGEDDLVEGLAVPYGVADLYATRFTPDTDLALGWFDRRPVLYGHGRDEPGTQPVGWTTTLRQTDRGLWVQAQLDRAAAWHKEIRQLIEAGALGWSHGTLDYLIELGPPDETGIREVRRWPLIELTLTPMPANPAARLIAARDAEPVLRILGVGSDLIRLVAARGWLPDGVTPGDLEDGDFAWLSDAYRRGDEPASVGRKLPYKIRGRVDPDGWRAAWSRAHQMSDADFAGGPSREEVIARLLRDKPADVEVADRSAADTIHALSVALGAACPAGEASARVADAGPRIRVTADAEREALLTLLRAHAEAEVRRLLGPKA